MASRETLKKQGASGAPHGHLGRVSNKSGGDRRPLAACRRTHDSRPPPRRPSSCRPWRHWLHSHAHTPHTLAVLGGHQPPARLHPNLGVVGLPAPGLECLLLPSLPRARHMRLLVVVARPLRFEPSSLAADRIISSGARRSLLSLSSNTPRASPPHLKSIFSSSTSPFLLAVSPRIAVSTSPRDLAPLLLCSSAPPPPPASFLLHQATFA